MILKKLLEIPAFRNAKVAAGSSGLHRTVVSVNMMDAPDIINYLKPDELLLTTAYAMKDNPDLLHQLVYHMSQHGCAGLGIKTKRFYDEIPAETIKYAELLEFPIIELPLEVSLGELLNDAFEYILKERTEELKGALNIHRDLSKLVMQGKGIPELTHSLSKLLKTSILLLDQELNPITSAGQVLNKSHTHHLNAVIEQMSKMQLFTKQKTSICLLKDLGFISREITIYPIHTYHKLSYLLLFTSLSSEQSFPELVIEQAINVIGFELMKSQAVKERSRRYKNEFFSDLADGLIQSEQEIINRGSNYGLLYNEPVYCIVGLRDDFRTSTAPSKSYDQYDYDQEHVYTQVKRSFALNGFHFKTFTKNEYIAILIMVDPSNDAQKNVNIDSMLNKLQSELTERFDYSLSFGIGRQVKRLMDIHISYKEAVDALQNGIYAGKQRFVENYYPSDILALLRQLPKDQLQKFYYDTFHPLSRMEDSDTLELLKTIAVYLENHCKVQDTAKKLFVHRNTVVYRLEKFEELMQVKLNNPQNSIRFRVAFQIQKIME